MTLIYLFFFLANFLELMARYDFKSPVKITLLFDDSDDDEIVNENDQNGNLETTQNGNEQDNSSFEEYSETDNLQTETESQQSTESSNETSVNEVLNGTGKKLRNNNPCFIHRLKENEPNDTSPSRRKEKPVNILNEPVHQCQVSADASYRQPSHVTCEPQGGTRQSEQYVAHQHDYTREPVSPIDDLLNAVSEHLIVVMCTYYRYGLNRKDGVDYKKREQAYRLIKHHYFQMSYHTTLSIIIPLEKNKLFTNTFIENTLMIAVNECRIGKCHRGHLEPIFNELLRWVKYEKSVKDRLRSQLGFDRHYNLKQQLNRPLQTNRPFLEAPTTRTQSITDDVCIFSSKNLGVKINVNRETLINYNITQYGTTIGLQGVQNRNQRRKSYQFRSENRNMKNACDNQTNNSKFNRRLTPYSMTNNSGNHRSQNTGNVIQGSPNVEHLRHKSHTVSQRRGEQSTQLQSNNHIVEIINPQNMVSYKIIRNLFS